MDLKTFREYLREIHKKGYSSYTLYFHGEYGGICTITDVYEDDDGDICLESGDGYDLEASAIYDRLRGYSGQAVVYMQFEGEEDPYDIYCGWYIDDDGDIGMDVH